MIRRSCSIFLYLLLTSVAFSAPFSWNGTSSADWSDWFSWTPNGNPGAADDVTIPNVFPFPQPVMDVNAIVNSLAIGINATLDVSGMSLAVGPGVFNIDNTAILYRNGGALESAPTDINSGTVVYQGVGGGTVQDYGVLDDYFNLEINGGALGTPFSLTAALQTANNLTVKNGGYLDVGGNSVTVVGAFDIENGGFLYRDGSGELVPQDNNTGTVVYDAAGGGTVQDYGAGNDYFALVIDGGGAGTPYTLGAALGTAGNLTMNALRYVDVGGNSVTVTGTYDNQGFLVRNGTGESVPQDNNSGTVVYDNALGGTVQDYGAGNDYFNLEIAEGAALTPYTLGAALGTGGTLTVESLGDLDVGGNSVTVTGAFDIANGGFLYRDGSGETVPQDNNSGTVVYDNALGGTVQDYGAGNDYFNLEIAEGAALAPYALGAALGTGGTLTVTSLGDLDVGGNSVTVTGAFDIANGGFLYRDGSGETVPQDNNTGTVVYDAAAGGTVQDYGAGNDYFNLEIAEGAALTPYTLGAALGTGGTLTVTSLGDLDVGGNSVTVTGAFNIANGGFLYRDGSGEVVPQDNNSGTVVYDAAAGGTVQDYGVGNDYWDLVIDGGTAIAPYTLGADLGVGNNLTVNNLANFEVFGNDAGVGGTMDIANGGFLYRTGGVGQAVAKDADSGTVVYRGAAAGNIEAYVGADYFNLTIDDAGSTFSLIAAIDVDGNLTITNGALSAAGFNINLAGNWDNNDTFTPGGNRVIFDATAGGPTIESGGTGAGKAFADIDFNCAGITYQLITNPLDVDGNLRILAGTLNAAGLQINMAGNWSNTAAVAEGFVSGGNTVVFDGFGAQNLDAGGTNNGFKDFSNVIVRFPGTAVTLINTDCEIDGQLWLDLTASFDKSGQNLDLGGNLTISNGSVWTAGATTFTLEGGASTLQDLNGVPVNIGNVVVNANAISQLTPIQMTDLTINALQQFNSAGFGLFISGNWINNLGGTYTSGGSTVTFNAAAGLATIDTGGVGVGQDFDFIAFDDGGGGATYRLINSTILINQDLTITGGNFDANGLTITINGNWTNGDTFTAGGNNVIFNGAGGQTLDPGGAAGAFNLLTKTNAGTLTVSGSNLFVNDTPAATLTIPLGFTVDMTSVEFTITTLVNNGTLELDGSQLTQTITNMDVDTGLVLYNGALGGTVRLANFFNLEINSALQTFTLNAGIDINGSLNIANGALDVSGLSHQINIAGNWTNSVGPGGFVERNGKVEFDGTSTLITDETFYIADILNGFSLDVNGMVMSLAGGGSYNCQNGAILYRLGGLAESAPKDNDTGRVVYRGAAMNQIQEYGNFDADYFDLEIAGTNWKYPTALLDVANDLIIAAGSVGLWSNNQNIRVAGSWLNNNNGSGFSSGTAFVELYGTGSIQAGTGPAAPAAFYDLLINTAAGPITLAYDVDVNNTITLQNGTLSAGAFPINVSMNWSNTGGFFNAGTGTVIFDRNGAQSVDPGPVAANNRFNNLQKISGGILTVANDIRIDATAAATLTIALGCTVDFQDKNFIIQWLNNNGTFALWGTQGTQTINNPDTNTGLTLYSNDGITPGVSSDVFLTQFFNLQFNDGGNNWTYTLSGAIDANGNITITSGTLDAVGFQINIAGNWSNSGTFTHNNNTVVFDNGLAAQTVNPGASSFFNLTKQGGQRLTLLTNLLTVDNNLTISAALDIMDMANQSFTITGTLFNNGTLEMDGTQGTQSIVTMDINSGTVLYNGAVGGTVRMTEFYDLVINGVGTFFLNADSTVYRDIFLNGGTFNGNTRILTVVRTFDSSGAGIFQHGTGEVVMNPPVAGNAFVNGSNTFHDFTCTVAGAQVYFEAGATQLIDAGSGGTFTIIGTVVQPIDLRSSASPAQWLITVDTGASINMQNVFVHDSFATLIIIVPPTVDATDNCTNWITLMLVTGSWTGDSDADGKIDFIEAEFPAAHNSDYTDLGVSVAGYRVTGFADHPIPAETDRFYILLAEGQELDTDATPLWEITGNNMLRDLASGTRVAQTNPGGETPTDNAQPLIGYTLAVADRNEVFVHFSEPVYQAPGVSLGAGDFTYSGVGNVTGLTPVTIAADGIGYEEVLLILDADVTADEVLVPTVIAEAVLGDVEDIVTLTLVSTNHPVSDVGLGLVGNGVMQPLWAMDETGRDPERGGIGLIRSFDGSEYLRSQDIQLQAHIHDDIVAPPVTSLYFDVDVPDSFKVGDLWLPVLAPGLTNGANTQARSVAETIVSGQLRNYVIPESDPEVRDRADVEFFFEIGGVYCGRLTNPNASDWYRGVRPWVISVRDVVTQRGGVSILNNVINPTRGETVKLLYELSKGGTVSIMVFDLKGDIVDVLYRGRRNAGDYSTSWDGRNRGGRVVARGIYFIKVVAPGVEEIRKVLVVK